MTLGQNEQVLKEWKYQTTHIKNMQIDNYLTVTNKRVISHSKGSAGISTNEIPISEIKGISASYQSIAKPSKIIMIALGVFAIILGLIFLFVSCSESSDTSNVVFGLMLLALGIMFLPLGLRKVSEINYYIVIKTANKENSSISIGNKSIKLNSALNNVTKIQVDTSCIKDIIDTLGALTIAQ